MCNSWLNLSSCVYFNFFCEKWVLFYHLKQICRINLHPKWLKISNCGKSRVQLPSSMGRKLQSTTFKWLFNNLKPRSNPVVHHPLARNALTLLFFLLSLLNHIERSSSLPTKMLVFVISYYGRLVIVCCCLSHWSWHVFQGNLRDN